MRSGWISLQAALLLLIVCLPGPLQAYSYVMVSDADLFEQADGVLRATVVAVQPAASGDRETRYRLQIDEALAGPPLQGTIWLALPGSHAARGWNLHIPGIPRLQSGGRLLVFYHQRADGVLQPQQLMLGLFARLIGGDQRALYWRPLAGGRELADKAPGDRSRFHQARDAEAFERWLRDRAGGDRRADDYLLPDRPVDLKYTFSTFNFSTPGPGRWFQFDSDLSLDWTARSDGQSATSFDEFASLQAALAAWSNDAGSRILMRYSGTLDSSPTCSLSSDPGCFSGHVLWNDPDSQIAGSYDCGSGGTLAIGGSLAFSNGQTFGGQTWYPRARAQVTVQDGAGCFMDEFDGDNGAELLTHEIGHAIGFGHSCGDGSSPLCSSAADLDDATMRALAHGDGRGAVLGADDRAGAAEIYPLPPGTGSVHASSDRDGRYLVFQSDTSSLVSGDSNGVSDIFRLDRDSSTLERISLDNSGGQLSGASIEPAISGDGQLVVFVSEDAGVGKGLPTAFEPVGAKGSATWGVYLRNLLTGSLTRLGTASSDGSGSRPQISADSPYSVVFAGEQSGQGSQIVQVTLNEASGEYSPSSPQCLSCNAIDSLGAFTGEATDGPSSHPTVSADARWVAWQTEASNALADAPAPCPNASSELILRNLLTGASRRVGAQNSSQCGDASGGAQRPHLSATGRWLVFDSDQPLLATDGNQLSDVYLADLERNSLQRLSQTWDGQDGNGASTEASISGDGASVAFISAATNLDPAGNDDNAVADVHLVSMPRLGLRRIGLAAGGPLDGPSRRPAFSHNGSLLLFDSTAANADVDPDHGNSNVLLRDNPWMANFEGTTRVFSDSLEGLPGKGSGSLAAWSQVEGSPQALCVGDTGFGARYRGLCALDVTLPGDPAWIGEASAHQDERILSLRFFLRPPASDSNVTVLRAHDDKGGNLLDIVYIAADQSLLFRLDGSTRTTVAQAAPAGRWSEVQFHYRAGDRFTAFVRHRGQRYPIASDLPVPDVGIGEIQLGLIEAFSGQAAALQFDEFESVRVIHNASSPFTLLPRGDANSDGQCSLADHAAVSNEIRGSAASGNPDCNQDGRISASDRACITAQVNGYCDE